MNTKPLIAVAMVIISVCVGCGTGKTQGVTHRRASGTGRKVQAVLVCPEASWEKGKSLTLLFAVVNGTGSHCRFDGRMEWPGNITLLVELPDSRRLLATPTMARLVRPTENDVVVLPPERLWGRRLLIDPSDKNLVKELRSPRPGRYTFWVEYFGYPNRSINCEKISLTSNRITVVVE